MACLLKQPLHYAGGVVAVRHVVAQGREAVGLATLLHFGELFQIELLILDCAPIVFGVIHREARSEGAVGADDEPVLTGAATPVFAYTAHEALHILQARNGINHFVALALLVNQPVEQIVDHGEILRADVGVVSVQVLEMGLLHHGSFVDVERERDSAVVGDFDKLFDVVDIRAADIGVEENGIAVAILPLHQIVEIRAHVFESFWQPSL